MSFRFARMATASCFIARSTRFMRAGALSLSALYALHPISASAQTLDDYKEHMDKGIKLYQDGNFEAAIAEFEAAYKIKSKAGPLINISLCYKARFRYPKAIAALEDALKKHGDTMDAATKKAAEDAIAEMRSLLGYVTVTLEPPHATLLVDGEPQAEDIKTRPIALGSGSHRIGAEAEGYASAEQSITVTSGDISGKIAISLVPDKGFVTIYTGDPDVAIAVDQKPLAYGEWSGFLTPGPHLVQMYGPQKKVPYTVQVLVVAGTTQEIRPGTGGMPLSAGMAVPPPPSLPPPPLSLNKEEALDPQMGWYGLASASLLFPLSVPLHAKDKVELSSGGAGGLRVGYRVNRYAGFEGMFSYGNSYLSNEANTFGYSHSAFRLGANLRLMSPGRAVRAVLTLAFCASYDRVYYDDDVAFNGRGWDPAVMTELGVEFNIGRVLVGAGLQGFFQSTRGIDLDSDTATQDTEAFEAGILTVMGGGLRVGYSVW